MRKTILAAVLSSLVAPAVAGGIPVIDIAGLAQAIEQYVELQKQLTELEAQRDIMNDQLSQLKGSFGYGGLLEGAGADELRRYAPAISAMGSALSGGSDPVSRHATALLEIYRMEDPAELFLGTDDHTTATRDAYGRERETYVSSYGVAAASYDLAPRRTANIETLSSRIDSASSVKAAADLQNRIAAENGHLLNEVARLQAAQLRSTSEYQAAELQRRAESQARFRRAAAANWAEAERVLRSRGR